MLVIDLDPQGNASTGLGIDRAKRAVHHLRVLWARRPRGGRPADRGAAAVVAPSTLDLSGSELEIGDMRATAR